jgi:signal transduction histidine kinase
LGLSISSKNVEAHGGTIAVHSELGQETQFTIRLPLAPAAPDPKLGRGA